MKKVENGVLEVNADVFIIPNSFGLPEELISGKEKMRDYMQAIISSSGGIVDECPMIMWESWIVAKEDLRTENLADHGGSFYHENGSEGDLDEVPRYLPAQLFDGHKEGDIVVMVIPKGFVVGAKTFDIKMHLRLAQKEYRYSRFGAFEDVFNERMTAFGATHRDAVTSYKSMINKEDKKS